MKRLLIVVGKDSASIDRFDTTHVNCEALLIANIRSEALSTIGNRYMDSCDLLGLVHADTIFRQGAIDVFFANAESRKIVGIVGRDYDGLYRWCFVTEDRPPAGKYGPVCTLDSCSVFLSSRLGLRFDSSTFNSFHCHVEDICMQARLIGIPVEVPYADATHDSKIPSPDWRKSYEPYRAALQRKWADAGALWTT